MLNLKMLKLRFNVKVYCITFFYIRVFDTEHLLFIRIYLVAI